MKKKKRVPAKRRRKAAVRRDAAKVVNSDSADIERAVYDGMQDLRARSRS